MKNFVHIYLDLLLPVDLSLVRTILQLGTVALLAITLLSLVGRLRFLELFTHFRLQYALAGIVSAIALAILHSPIFAALALIVTVANSCYVAPFYLITPQRAPGPTVGLKLMLANVLYVNFRYGKLLAQIANQKPDLVVLQEFTPEWLAATASLKTTYPYSFVRERPSGAGIAVFCRYPLSETEAIRFDATERAGVVTRLDVEGTSITLLTIHPSTPMTARNFRERNNQLEQAALRLRANDGPRIMAGDLNTSVFSSYFHDLVRNGEVRDARRGFGLLTSWPHPLPALLRIPIDHCLVSHDIQVEKIRTGRGIGSDHLPLLIELRVPKAVK